MAYLWDSNILRHYSDDHPLLEDTLVIWCGEFGRTPVSEKGNGRDHNPYGFTMWLAGGGVKAGMAYGATDEFGFRAVEKQVSIHARPFTRPRCRIPDHAAR